MKLILPSLFLAALLIQPACAQDQRKWKDTQGRTIDATFLAVEGDSVKLKLANGKTSLVPLAKLSEADQQWVKEREEAYKPAPDPAPAPDKAKPAEPAKDVNWAPLQDIGDKSTPGLIMPSASPEESIIAVATEKRFVKADGSIAFPKYKFTSVTPFSEDMAWVTTADLKGYINLEGNFVIGGDSKVPLPADGIEFESFKDGRALFRTKDSIGYLDPLGTIAIPAGKFKRGMTFSEGLAAVSTEAPGPDNAQFPGMGQWQYIDGGGEVVIPGPYTWPQAFSSGVAVVGTDLARKENDGPVALINSAGDKYPVQVPAKGIPPVSGGAYVISGDNVVNLQGEVIIPAKGAGYSVQVLQSTVPIAFAKYDKRPGGRLIHLPTKSVYGPSIDWDVEFHEGFAAVPSGTGGNKWGAIDLTGNIVIPPAFSEAPRFQDGYAITKRFGGEKEGGEQTVVIDRKGKIVWQGEVAKH